MEEMRRIRVVLLERISSHATQERRTIGVAVSKKKKSEEKNELSKMYLLDLKNVTVRNCNMTSTAIRFVPPCCCSWVFFVLLVK
jgi:hypothetical protein